MTPAPTPTPHAAARLRACRVPDGGPENSAGAGVEGTAVARDGTRPG